MKRRFVLAVILLFCLSFTLIGCENGEVGVQQPEQDNQDNTPEIVLENEVFKIFEPAPQSEVEDHFIVRGLASVFEGTIQYEFEDGHFILDKGFVTASEGGPGWGEFEIKIDLDDAVDGSAMVVLYEESAKDGSRLHELIIPVVVKK